MDRTPSTILIDDAEAILGSIRDAILLDLQEPGKRNVYGELGTEIEALRSQVERSPEIDEKLNLLGTLARAAAETGKERTKFQILDVLSSIESVLVGIDLTEAQFSDELLEIVESSFESFPQTKPH